MLYYIEIMFPHWLISVFIDYSVSFNVHMKKLDCLKIQKINQEKISIDILKSALWDTELHEIPSEAERGVLDFFTRHAIPGMLLNVVKATSFSETVGSQIRKRIFSQICKYRNIVYLQENILGSFQSEKIPIVVLKGTSAAQYYPIPEYRAMGDIDLLVRPDDFEKATKVLLTNGWKQIEDDNGRHAVFIKNGVELELHYKFASDNIAVQTEVFDGLLYAGLSEDQTVLPDSLNGLVLLEHVAQHMNNGIGLRQIIDWMMFVHQCLHDQEWHDEFEALVEKVHMKTFAITVTRMCQIHLGLPDAISWCQGADEKLCAELFDYVLQCGNFGMLRAKSESGGLTRVPSWKHPIKLYQYVQACGEKTWPVLKRRPWLRPFAFIYQGLKYLNIILEDRTHIRGAFSEGERRKKMFQKLEIFLEK